MGTASGTGRGGLALRLALRDLRGGLTGLRLLAICLFLGVAALAAVGSLSASIVTALGLQGQAILGGDVRFEIAQRDATPEEQAAFAAMGKASKVIRMRAMAARADGQESVLAELKAVDNAWPLYGRLGLASGARAPRPAGKGIAIAPALADRLRIGIGDPIHIGETRFTVTGLIADEPDRIGSGFTLGPTALVDMAGLGATGLIQPGSLYRVQYRVALPPSADPAAVIARFERQFPGAGWEARDRTNGSPGTRRFIERLGQFLSLVGLTALVVAGIGVGNGVASWLDGKRGGIATLKALGASSATIFRIYLIQILLVAGAGIAAGLLVGALVPFAVAAIAGDALPVPPELGLYPKPLAIAAAYGLLVATAFALAPLARARSVPAASLFRGGIMPSGRPTLPVLLAMTALALAIAGLAIGTAREPLFAALFVAASMLLLGLLTAIGAAIRAIAARLPRPRRPLPRLALANLHRPAAQTTRLVIALGLGLTLFTALAVIETNLSGQLQRTVPNKAPSFFILDIPAPELDRFKTLVNRTAPGAEVVTVPSLRGPVVALGDRRVAEMKNVPEGAWILRGDRGLTYAATLPEGSRVVEGKWWPADYAGPPLVSLDVEAARLLNLKIGDRITVSVLGVEIEATIASLREIAWDTMGFNFVLIFSPGTLEGAPHSMMATVAMAPERESALNRAVTSAFPSVSLIRVKEVIATVADLLSQLSVAVRAAASVAVAAGIAVLIGAIAAARRARIYDAVLLKLLGATRRQVLAVQAMEYALLSLVVSLLALAFGTAAGWYVVRYVLDLEWAPDWWIVLATLGIGALLTMAIGLAGSLPALAARPARALREL
ncbi:ABC transporter permease [Sphingomonas oleivorans]|uniref:ABC transporter permease n=1 Tax=Sphingomonas oleivorans TaxID=1735121 RepID=A0A2T5FVZ6_9SPHN|nr:FtsX-like permease family protein [Sphingomonas oleivorans]PTQ09956.1 ABC transporter permease [Sphingomonas oleivorans]